MTEAEANRAAFFLLTENSALVGAVLAHLMGTQIITITSSEPDEAQKRNDAYFTIRAINDIDALLRNMAEQHKHSTPA